VLMSVAALTSTARLEMSGYVIRPRHAPRRQQEARPTATYAPGQSTSRCKALNPAIARLPQASEALDVRASGRARPDGS
jgi:hypothetical protein